MYIVLEGEGLMTIEKKNYIVKKGDMILNSSGEKYGLVNNSDKDINLLIIQVSINE